MSDENRPTEPIDLAREPDFSLGALKISPSLREVTRLGQRESLEPKAMQVLVALARIPDRVVSRDELISRCWEGRIVGEDAINRVIGRLRRLSEADNGQSFVIETIPKVGFRLRVPAAPAQSDPAPAVPAPAATLAPREPVAASRPVASASPPRQRRWRLFGALALLILAACVMTAWMLWPSPRWRVVSSRSFLSSLALEDYPAISPNGTMLAYTSAPDQQPRKIYVRNLAGGDGIRISSDAYDDVSPSWSSDGARLAYVAQKLGEPCHIMVVTVPAGETREAGRCNVHYISWLSWQAGTPFVYYLDGRNFSEDRLVRLNVDSGEKTILSGTTPTDALVDLRCSPDGKLLAYLPLVGQSNPVIVHNLLTGKETILGYVPQSATGNFDDSIAWTEDSKSVLVSVSNGVGSDITAYPVDGSPAYSVYTAATTVVHLSAGGGQLAVAIDIGRKNLARVTSAPGMQTDNIDPSNGASRSPTFAPDGTLAFISNRSGSNAVWIMKPGSAPTVLFDAGLASLIRVVFSPDGSRLALARYSSFGSVRYEILTTKGAVVQSFEMNSTMVGYPSWTPDGEGLIVYDNRINRPVRVDLRDPSRRTPVAPPQWMGVTMRNDGVFATRYDQLGLWRIDKGIRLVNGSYPTAFSPPIAFKDDAAIVPDFNADGGPRVLAQPLDGAPARLIGYAPGAHYLNSGFTSTFAANPKTGEVIYVAAVLNDANINLLTLAKR